jgi:vancomycin resistance protein YoaR
MSATARIDEVAAGWRSAAGRRPVPTRVVAGWLTRAFIVVAIFLGAGALGLGLYASAHGDRIYEGVEVAGVRVGGMTAAEAGAALERQFAHYAATPLTLTAGGKSFGITPAAAGARLDERATVAAAFGYGREGSLWTRSRAWVEGMLHPATVAPRVTVDAGKVDGQLRAIAPGIVRAPVDAAIRMSGEGQPALVEDVPGVALDLGATGAELVDRMTRLDDTPVAVVTRAKAAEVRTAPLAPRLPAARAAVAAPLVLSADEGVWYVDTADLKRVVSVDPRQAKLEVDRGSLTTMVVGLAAEIDREPLDAGITVDDNGALAVVPGTDLARVDVGATANGIAAALLGGKHSVPLVVDRAPPAITDKVAATAVSAGERLIDDGMDLTWSGGRARLGRSDLLKALTITARPGQRQPFAFGLDADVVGELLQPVAAGFDQPAVNARFRLINGQIGVVSQAKRGRALDPAAGVKAVLAAFGKPDPAATLTAKTIEPRYTAAAIDQIHLGNDLLAEASTSYAQSSEPRRNNVERAVSLESGWLVPPDGIFSYDQNIGAVDQTNSFVTGYGIVADQNGGVTTAPVMGGGICQISTTIFQAAFWAGMPIVERYQHPYYLRSYGEAPHGLPGLDAMVDIEKDWQLDFKFRNTTGHWIAVTLTADGETAAAQIIGTNPNWDIQVSDPAISNVVTADTTMHYMDSPELPAGQELLVESAQDGFDVTIQRTVAKGGKTLDELTLSSSFAAARNTTLRGTG